MSEKVPAVHGDAVSTDYRQRGLWPTYTLGEKVREWAHLRPDAIAVVDGTDGRQITYRRLADDVARIAGWLIDQGVRIGDGVSVQLPNRYETVVVGVAALSVGACINPLLPNYRRKELAHFLQVTQAKVFASPAHYRGFDHATLSSELCEQAPSRPVLLVVDQDETTAHGVSFAQALAHDPIATWPELDAGAVSEVIFTSGTESLPKAVMHTEETVNHSVEASLAHLSMDEDDVVWMPSPIGHSTGFNFGVRLALVAGITVVLQDIWKPRVAAQLIEEHRCTYTLAASTFLTDLLRAAREDNRDLRSLHTFGCGGGPVATELVREAAEQGVTVLRIYGSTEGLIISWNQRTSPETKRLDTDGLPPAHTEVQAWDPLGHQVSTGDVGELMVRGPNVCVGFFDDPERTSATFTADGWLHSGDLGYVDAEGYVTVSGRMKETIVRGGLNIAPREIEDLLAGMPGLRDVAVIGIHDKRLGEIVGVCAVADPGADLTLERVLEYLDTKELARYKMPQAFKVVPEIPRTPTGKIRRTALAGHVNDEREPNR